MEPLAKSVHDMRRRLRANYGDAPEWQLRKQPGGISELDLLIQGLRLLNADLFPELAMAPATLLDRMVTAGRVTIEDAADLAAAQDLFADLQQALRLVVGSSVVAPEALSSAAAGFVLDSCDSPDSETLRARIAAHRARVETLFDRLVPPPSS